VQMPGRTSVITRDETGTEHQFNLYEDGKFYHLTSTPDESAHGGMAKVRYAGQCAEE